jgi:Flp pilus assembly protein TadG
MDTKTLKMSKLSRRTEGQALVEFALTATLLITLLLGIFDFGRAYYTQVQIKNAVGDAGYYAIQHAGSTNDSGIRSAIKNQLGNLNPVISDGNITIARTCASGAGNTHIKVTYQYHLIFSWIVSNAQVTLGDETYVPQLDTCT